MLNDHYCTSGVDLGGKRYFALLPNGWTSRTTGQDHQRGHGMIARHIGSIKEPPPCQLSSEDTLDQRDALLETMISWAIPSPGDSCACKGVLD